MITDLHNIYLAERSAEHIWLNVGNRFRSIWVCSWTRIHRCVVV